MPRKKREGSGVHPGSECQNVRGSLPSPPPDIDAICGAIIDLQVRRKFVVKTETKCTNSVTGLTARMCGFDANADESSRKKVQDRAARIVANALAEKAQSEDDAEVAAVIAAELETVRQMLQPLWIRRSEIEKEMQRLAKSLIEGNALGGFIAATPGFTAFCLAVIVGEAGNLSNYASVRRLWRRLGFGMAQGHEQHAYSTWRKHGGLTKEDWIAAGYKPSRLGEIYGVVTMPLAMHKKKNKYGLVYEARRLRTMQTHPEWYLDKDGKPKVDKTGKPSSQHAHNDALRIMTKALIADLWSAWRGSKKAMESFSRLAPAELIAAE